MSHKFKLFLSFFLLSFSGFFWVNYSLVNGRVLAETSTQEKSSTQDIPETSNQKKSSTQNIPKTSNQKKSSTQKTFDKLREIIFNIKFYQPSPSVPQRRGGGTCR
ncbi:MAG: hypothetical protein SWX82_12005 [Cyanobacteriota bacterium]|nr:hypothetical protein [Cyanobacteriota bacterium]